MSTEMLFVYGQNGVFSHTWENRSVRLANTSKALSSLTFHEDGKTVPFPEDMVLVDETVKETMTAADWIRKYPDQLAVTIYCDHDYQLLCQDKVLLKISYAPSHTIKIHHVV